MSQPPAMTIETRRTLVRQLADSDSTLSARAIALQVGVSKDTVLRDLAETRPAQNQPESAEPAVEPDRETDSDWLVIHLDDEMRQALAVLRATRNGPDTDTANRAAARAAIRAMADIVIESGQRRP